MKVTGSLLGSIGKILFKKSYFLNIDVNELLAILKRGFKKPSKRKVRAHKNKDDASE